MTFSPTLSGAENTAGPPRAWSVVWRGLVSQGNADVTTERGALSRPPEWFPHVAPPGSWGRGRVSPRRLRPRSPGGQGAVLSLLPCALRPAQLLMNFPWLSSPPGNGGGVLPAKAGCAGRLWFSVTARTRREAVDLPELIRAAAEPGRVGEGGRGQTWLQPRQAEGDMERKPAGGGGEMPQGFPPDRLLFTGHDWPSLHRLTDHSWRPQAGH